MHRRDVLQLLSLSALAVVAAPALAACGDTPSCGDSGASGCGNVPPVAAAKGDLDLVSSDVARAPGDPAAVGGLVASLHTLGGGLLRALDAQPGNLALSPYSVGVALALTLNGAKGRTLSQMTGLFDDAHTTTVNGGLDALTADVDALTRTIHLGGAEKAEVVVAAANGLFGQQGETFEPRFLDALARSYGAALHVVDYEGDADGATTAINDWTAQHTHDKIADIIPPGVLDDTTRLVLVNALYLKAPWLSTFERSATAATAFTRADGSTVTAQLMRGEAGLAPYASGDGWAAASLPYAGSRLAMTIVLPDEGRLDDVQADLEAGHLPRYLSALSDQGVQVSLPRFTVRTQADLVKPLEDLGMTDAFDADTADLTGITTQERLYVSDVRHQVFVAVDEDGTEAAAATAVVVRDTSALVPGANLVADRTFFFVIHDVAHGTPLFLGRVDDPTAS